MSRNFSLDNRVWAISGDRTDPDTVTTSEANLLTVEVGHIDSQGPFSDMMNWEQHRVSEMLNAVEQGGVLDWSSKTEYHVRGLCLGDDGQIYQSRKDKNKGHPITDTSWWIEYIPTGMGDMLASVYDKDGNGIVDNSQKVNGVDTSANHTYYGKDQSGNIGFHAVPPDGDMKKSVYDTNNNGIVDKAEMVNGANSAGPKKYYGTDNDNKVGFFDLPPDGDMLKSVYDTDNSGRVDTAESVFGINSASSTAYYGKNKAGDIGFHDFISQLPETATRWPTADEAGAYAIGSTVYDSDRLSGMLASGLADPDTIAQRDAEGNSRFGTVRTGIANETSIGDASCVAFRGNNSDQNHLRFIGSAPLKKWLKLTKSDVGLNQLNNYPISHKADETATSKTAYASEYAVGVAWDLAKKAMDIAAGGGGSAYADEAGKLATARTIALAGDVTGSVNFDGSQNVSMTTSVADNSHKHQWSNLTSVPSTASRWPSWGEVTSKPSSFPPAAHTHTAADVGAMPVVGNVNFMWGGTGSQMPSHYFHDTYESSGDKRNTYIHFYPKDETESYNSSVEFRVRDGLSFKSCVYDGKNIILAGIGKVYHPQNPPSAKDVNAVEVLPFVPSPGRDPKDYQNAVGFSYSNGQPVVGSFFTFGYDNYQVQIAKSYSGASRTYIRSQNGDSGGTFNPWETVFTDKHPPTAKDIAGLENMGKTVSAGAELQSPYSADWQTVYWALMRDPHSLLTYNSANGTFTTKIAGYYEIDATAYRKAQGSGTYVHGRLMLDSEVNQTDSYTDDHASLPIRCVSYVYLKAGVKISFQVKGGAPVPGSPGSLLIRYAKA